MSEKINEQASVITVYDHLKGTTQPWRIKWRERVYQVSEIGYHHTRESGTTLYHIFSLSAGSLFFRLSLNTQTLVWRIEEVADRESN
ncbi:MAG TPA: hypothetical protein VG935_02115 [Patescibacteria group bacterium]|nr:hypothetical protein [Patescibacteria group bacterium]